MVDYIELSKTERNKEGNINKNIHNNSIKRDFYMFNDAVEVKCNMKVFLKNIYWFSNKIESKKVPLIYSNPEENMFTL